MQNLLLKLLNSSILPVFITPVFLFVMYFLVKLCNWSEEKIRARRIANDSAILASIVLIDRIRAINALDINPTPKPKEARYVTSIQNEKIRTRTIDKEQSA